MNDQVLEKELTKTRNSLSADRLDMSFGEIMGMYEREELIIFPEFQRLFRWTDYQKTRFIESLLLGIPIPPIFVAEDIEGKWELVDGLQRLSTVLSFFSLLKSSKEKNGWKLIEGELVESLENYDNQTLPFKFQLNIKRAVCRIEIIKWNSQMDMRYELFNRLNTGGSPLTDQEIRNCIFRGISNEFNEVLKRVAGNKDFIALISPTEKQISELYLEELVLRFMSIYNNSNNIKENLGKHMTEYMRIALVTGDNNLEKENLLLRVISLLKPLGKDVFRSRKGTLSTSLYEAITIGIASNINYYEAEGSNLIKKKIDILKKDKDFSQFTGSASHSKTRIINRMKIAEKIFGV